MENHDVIVIGGGPAGSSAALILGRSRLDVLLIDKATPRNIRTHGVHGYLTRDHIAPVEFRRIAHEEVLSVGVKIMYGEVDRLEQVEEGFLVLLADGSVYSSLRVVVATGMRDQMPDIEGMDALYGSSVFHCPFCDGWEMRDKPIGVVAKGKKGVAIAKGMLTWSNDVMLFTNGPTLRKDDLSAAQQAEIPVFTQKIRRMIGSKGQLEQIELHGGEKIARHAVFFDPDPTQQCTIATSLGCRVSKSGAIYTDKRQRTEIPGLYVAGDAAADPNMVVVAAADGVKAALNVVQELQKAGHWLPANRAKRKRAG